MNIKIHRIYEDDTSQGYQVLVDRLWPRGISKEEADLDAHWKDLAPGNELRKWFDHDPDCTPSYPGRSAVTERWG